MTRGVRSCRLLLTAFVFMLLPSASSLASPDGSDAITEFFSPIYEYTLSISPRDGSPYTITVRPGTLLTITATSPAGPHPHAFPRRYAGSLVLRAHAPDPLERADERADSHRPHSASSAATFLLRFDSARVVVSREELDLTAAR